jgi:hypothetical protein
MCPPARDALLFFLAFAVAGSSAPVLAQQADPKPSPFHLSMEQIRAAIEVPRNMTGAADGPFFRAREPNGFRYGQPTLAQPQPNDLRLGPITLMQCPALFVCANVPAGDLVSRTVHAIANSRHHHAESAARAEVLKDLADFQNVQLK